MAHKKGEGSTQNGRESHSKRLGVKIFGGSPAVAGKHPRPPARHPATTPARTWASAWTTPSTRLVDGVVEFRRKRDDKSYVSVIPAEAPKA
jgi:large subunit ribosomal protein L27